MHSNGFKWIGILFIALSIGTLFNLSNDASSNTTQIVATAIVCILLLFYGKHLIKNRRWNIRKS